jgi:hypothetical protein
VGGGGRKNDERETGERETRSESQTHAASRQGIRVWRGLYSASKL